MAQCLLLEDRARICLLYKLNLRVYVGLDVIHRTTIQDSLDLIDSFPNIDLIIVPAHLKEKKQSAKFLYEALNKKQLKIPMMVMGTEAELESKVTFVEPIEVKHLLMKAASILGVSASDMAKKIYSEHYELELFYFKVLKKAPCDIFIKVVQQDTSLAFFTLKEKGLPTSFEDNFLKTLISKGVTSLFIRSKDRLVFVKAFTDELLSQLHKEVLSFEERLKLNEAAWGFTRDEILSKGLTEEAVEVAKAGMESIYKLADESTHKGLLDALQSITKEPQGYRYQLLQLTNILAFFAMNHLEWLNHKEHKEKVNFLPFLATF